MADDLFSSVYNPDVLSCLANLSNDEVFTPPDVVNKMLDMLPQELFRHPDTTFLDPACKTGVFMREIAKRLITGLEPQIPDLQERIDHIFHKQLYAIAITELTSLLSRRGVYCSKYPNSEFSVTQFDDAEGNIRYRNIKHSWVNGKCKFCGISKDTVLGGSDRGQTLESHAYEWIHTLKPEEIFNMKFDVIIGNPPYQLSFGIEGSNSSNAKSIYNEFISQAIKLKPRFLSMITPSRWMTKTSQGIPEQWVESMLKSNKFKVVHDFENSSDCFPGVSIMGGVNYFLWDREHNGKCEYYFHYNNDEKVEFRNDYLDPNNSGIVIRDPKSFSILEKITKVESNYYNNDNKCFTGLVSPKHFFDDGKVLTSNWKDYKNNRDNIFSIKYYLNRNLGTVGWITRKQIPKNHETINLHKVFIPAANGSNEFVLGKPFYGEPNSICSQTYLVIGYDPEKHNFTEEECKNIISYIATRFFRYLVSIKKKTQNGPRGVYQFVPLQDFSKPWTDEELYKKYGLIEDEIEFIESMIRPMELGGDTDAD